MIGISAFLPGVGPPPLPAAEACIGRELDGAGLPASVEPPAVAVPLGAIEALP